MRQSPARVVVDTDPGIDDVVTLALVARSPELQLLAVTTTYGNAGLSSTTRNAAAILALNGRADIPVCPGAGRPRNRPLTTAPETHGPTGVGYAAGGADSSTVVPNPTVLRNVLARTNSPVTLVTLGPLTNLAALIEVDAAMAHECIARHIGMFGNLRERGNTNRWADFNAWSDPEAVDLVLRSGIPTQMVGLDVTRRMTLAAAEVEMLGKSSDPMTRWLADALRFYVEFHRSQERLEGCVVNDILTIGELISPGMLRFEKLQLRVGLDEGEHRGHTQEAAAGPVVEVATAVDVSVMRHLLVRVFGRAWFERFHQEQ